MKSILMFLALGFTLFAAPTACDVSAARQLAARRQADYTIRNWQPGSAALSLVMPEAPVE